MYNIERLIVKNIGPIQEIDHTFEQLVILLTGENRTDEGQDSNGSGKSYLVESIVYALIGASFRKVTDSELIREGEDKAEITLFLRNTVQDKRLLIERSITTKKGSSLSWALNDEYQDHLTTSINQGNKEILKELGLSREDILNYFTISKERYASFFTSSDKDKKELISRFSKANLIDEIFPKIESDQKSVDDEIAAVERQILKTETKIETLRESSDPEKIEAQKLEILDKIEDFLKDKERLERTNAQNEGEIKELEKGIKRLQLELKNVPSVEDVKEKLSGRNIDLSSIKQEIRRIEKERRESNEMIVSIEKNLHGLVTCPKCKHEFNFSDPDLDLEEERLVLIELKDVLSHFDSEIALREVELEEIQKSVSDLNDEILKSNRQRSEIENKINTYENKISITKRSIQSNERIIGDIESEIVRLSEIDIEPKSEKEIKELQKELKTLEKKVGELLKKSQGFSEWLITFKNFKTYLANKSLSNITGYTNMYLEKLGSSIRVKFEGYKELKSGKVKENITTRIFKFGEDKGNFNKLSGGEKARVEIATILALSGLINSSSNQSGLNMVIIDEILESLDSTGLKSLLKAMGNLNQTVMLITHGKLEVAEGYRLLTVVKENHISRIK